MSSPSARRGMSFAQSAGDRFWVSSFRSMPTQYPGVARGVVDPGDSDSPMEGRSSEQGSTICPQGISILVLFGRLLDRLPRAMALVGLVDPEDPHDSGPGTGQPRRPPIRIPQTGTHDSAVGLEGPRAHPAPEGFCLSSLLPAEYGPPSSWTSPTAASPDVTPGARSWRPPIRARYRSESAERTDAGPRP